MLGKKVVKTITLTSFILICFLGNGAWGSPMIFVSETGEDSLSGIFTIYPGHNIKQLDIFCMGSLKPTRHLDPRYPDPKIKLLIKTPSITFKKEYDPNSSGYVQGRVPLPREFLYHGK